MKNKFLDTKTDKINKQGITTKTEETFFPGQIVFLSMSQITIRIVLPGKNNK